MNRVLTAELEQLGNQFLYHAPGGNQVERYAALRSQGLKLAELMARCCPIQSDEYRQAILSLRAAIMWANAAIACNEEPNAVVGFQAPVDFFPESGKAR